MKSILSDGIMVRNNKRVFALSFEGYSYRFDKFVSADTRNDGVVALEIALAVSIVQMMRTTVIQTRTPHREHCIPDSNARAIEFVVSDLQM